MIVSLGGIDLRGDIKNSNEGDQDFGNCSEQNYLKEGLKLTSTTVHTSEQNFEEKRMFSGILDKPAGCLFLLKRGGVDIVRIKTPRNPISLATPQD